MSKVRYKYWFWIAILLAGVNDIAAQNRAIAIIPQPQSIRFTNEAFTIQRTTHISAPDSLAGVVNLMNDYVQEAYHFSLTKKSNPITANSISLQIDSTLIPETEGYKILIQKQWVRITAHDAIGLIHGVETLRQMMLQQPSGQLAGCIITDNPRFAYRGMSLDVSRHMFPPSFIKKYIDLLALYKFNTFHWHITDDQGWRIEIKKYPLLQTKAAYRDETLIGHKKDVPHRFDGKRYGGYYTQEEIKEIISYALQRGITIIPEIEMPGHALAALSAYPNLGCTGGPYKTATFWGIFDDVYCAGNDSTFQFLEGVLDEVMDLFPSEYIHIGGDECLKTRWKECPKCQRRMRAEHLSNEEELQSYFVQRIEKYINSKGRQIIGWDEILEGGLAPNATVMSWRGTEGGIAAAKQHHNVIMTPESHLYFDYYQSLYKEEPLASGSYLPLQKVYSYEPVDESLEDSLTHYIQGVEGQAWSEYYVSAKRAEYAIFPRAIALAELGWTSKENKNESFFLSRLRAQEKLLKKLDVNYFPYFDEIHFAVDSVSKKRLTLSLQTSLPGASIRYTTNGEIPALQSPVYTSSITINKSCILKAQLFNKENQPVDRLFQKEFFISQSTGAKVRLKASPVARFNTNPAVLTNGIFASDLYNDNQWIGFAGDDCEATVDLGDITSFNTVSLHFLNYHWQKMWAPQTVRLSVSDDDKNYHEIFVKNKLSGNGIITVDAHLQSQKARYIKVIATNKGIIPKGEYGEGGKALLLIDEVQVK